MKSKNINITLIKEKINSIKNNSLGQSFSNYFWQEKFDDKLFFAIFGDETLVFWEQENDFFRLYFFTSNINELERIILKIEDRPLIIDYITNEPLVILENIFQNSGFICYAKMLRFRNSNIPILNSISGSNEVKVTKNNNILNKLEVFFLKYPGKNIVEFAIDSDAESILILLYNKLDKLLGHFPTLTEIAELIKKQQIIVIKENNKISGLLIFKITGKTCNMDQGYSDPSNDELINMKMFFEFYKILNRKAIKSLYLWVKEDNITVINLHQSFGLKPDGLLDFVYIKK